MLKSVKNEKFNDPSENHAREVAVKSENVTSIINVKNPSLPPNNEVDVLSVSSDLEGDSYHMKNSDSKISKISKILGAETVKNLKNNDKNSHKVSSNILKKSCKNSETVIPSNCKGAKHPKFVEKLDDSEPIATSKLDIYTTIGGGAKIDGPPQKNPNRLGCLTVDNTSIEGLIPTDKVTHDLINIPVERQLTEKVNDNVVKVEIDKRDHTDNLDSTVTEKNQVDVKLEKNSEKFSGQQRHLSTELKTLHRKADNPVQRPLSSATGTYRLKTGNPVQPSRSTDISKSGQTSLHSIHQSNNRLVVKTGSRIISSRKDDSKNEKVKLDKIQPKKLPKTDNNELKEVFERIKIKKKLQEERKKENVDKNKVEKVEKEDYNSQKDKNEIENEDSSSQKDKNDKDLKDKNIEKSDENKDKKQEKVSFLRILFERGKEKENMSKIPNKTPSKRVRKLRKGSSSSIPKDQRSIDTFLVRKDVGQNLPNSGKRKCNFVDDNFATGSPSTPKKRNLVGNLASLGVQGKLGQPEK